MRLYEPEKYKNKAGFTLVELLVAMMVTVFLLIIAYTMANRTNTARDAINESAELQRKAQRALDVMVDEFRMAHEVFEFEQEFVEPPVASTWFTFRSFNNFMITYYVDPSTHELKRHVVQQDGTINDTLLTDRVLGCYFYPYHAQGNLVVSPDEVYFIVIVLVMRGDTTTSVLRTGVRFRNRYQSTE